MSKPWFVVPCLLKLQEQLKAKYPGIVLYNYRDPKIGGPSAHKPEADGSVDAVDIMLGKVFTKEDADKLVETLVKEKDRRIKNIIWYERIILDDDWVWRPYHGERDHKDHIHIEIDDQYQNDKATWVIEQKRRPLTINLMGQKLPTIKYGDNDDNWAGYKRIWRIQRILGITADGDYGDQTAKALKDFCGGNGRSVGLSEWRKLYGLE